MPRPKSDRTNSGRNIGVRMSEWEYQEYKKLGGTKWLRKVILDSKRKREGISTTSA